MLPSLHETRVENLSGLIVIVVIHRLLKYTQKYISNKV